MGKFFFFKWPQFIVKGFRFLATFENEIMNEASISVRMN